MNNYVLIDSDYTDNNPGCSCCPDFEYYFVERIFETEKELSEHFAQQHGCVLLELTEDPELKEVLESINEDTDMNHLDDLCKEVFKGEDPAPRPTKFLVATLITNGKLHELQQAIAPEESSDDLIALGRKHGNSMKLTCTRNILMF